MTTRLHFLIFCSFCTLISGFGTKPLFLTFDLDDTLFDTSAVVRSANHAMLDYIKHKTGASITPDDFIATTRRVRHGLAEAVSYSDLRKLAIKEYIKNNDSEILVQDTFQIWLDERHAAADRYLFPHVVESLQSIQQVHDACIAAITNGRGDPLQMSTLSCYFEFCVSGEDTFPYRKPHPKIYETALSRYKMQNNNNNDNDFVWIHVGDCLANDVAASADCGAYAIWCDQESVSKNQFYSTASSAEMSKRQELAEAGKELVAVRISNMKELLPAIEKIMEQAT